MDDFTLSNLYESKNEWSARLVSILTPVIVHGFHSIFDESWKLCKENNEKEKYLMTLQNLLSRVPKWNDTILEKENQRIVEQTNCTYLGDLLSCVHVIQLKILTCVRAGKEQKKIDIDIPKFTTFLHHVYINAARRIYSNIYLYEQNVTPLQRQKYNREIEIIVQESIINTVRANMPIEELLRAYIDESIEEDVKEEITEKTYDVEEKKEEASENDGEWNKLDDDTLKNGGSIDEAKAKADEISVATISTDEGATNEDKLVVSNNLSTEFDSNPVEDSSNQKAITFNEEVRTNDLDVIDLSDRPLEILDENVNIDIESLDPHEKESDQIQLDIEELP